MEIVAQVPDLDTVIVPIGGAGLIAGVALAVKTLKPEAQIIGVEPERAASFTAAMAAGEILAPAATAAGRAFEVLDPRGRRALSFADSARGAAVELEETGFWRVLRGGGRERVIAANVDRRESDLEPVQEETLRLWPAAAAAAGQGGGAPPERPLALWLLAAALAAAVVEAVLASIHLGKVTA